MHVCLLGATYATNNLGVNALTDGAVRCILHRYPRAWVSLLDYGKQMRTYAYTDGIDSARLPLVNIRFSKWPFVRNHVATLILAAAIARLLPSRRLRDSWIRHWPVLRHLRSCSLAAAISGGDSFSDMYGSRRFFYVVLPQVLALTAGVPLVLLPQTIGPFRTRLCGWVARQLLAKAHLVYSRDQKGLAYTRALLRRSPSDDRVRFCYDVGFVLQPAREPPPSAEQLTSLRKAGHLVVGVNVSGLLAMGGYNRRNMFGLQADYQRLMRSILDRVLQVPQVVVVLVPHVFGTHNPESDEAVCRKLYHTAGTAYGSRLLLATAANNQRTAKALIGNCDFFIGSRMHACIAALSQTVPAVGVAYSDKFAGVMRSLELERLVIDIREENEAHAVERIAALLATRDEIRAHLQQTIPTVIARVLGLFDDIQSTTTGGAHVQQNRKRS